MPVSDFSQSISVVFPASWPDREDAHCTIMYLGEIPDVSFTKAQLLAAVQPVAPGTYLAADTAGVEMFGPDNDIPVVPLQHPLLDVIHKMMTIELLSVGIESASEFTEYRPHVTITDADTDIPSIIILGPPVVWWGLDHSNE